MSEAAAPYENEPKGREQEAALIGAVLRRPAIFQDLREVVSAEQFGYSAYREAWTAMATLADGDQGIDTLTIGDELDRRGRLKDWSAHDRPGVVGRIALSYLREEGQPQNAKDYAENVIDYAAKRELLEIAQKLAYYAANGRKASDIMTDIEKRLAGVQVGSGQTAKHTQTLKEAVRDASDRTDRAARGEIEYIQTGYKDLDNIITGFTEPDLTIVAGRPGQGKTALLASIAQNVIQRGKRVAFFSLEMSSEQVGMRFISMMAGVSFDKQLTGKLSGDEWTAYYDAIGKLDYNLVINDMPAISPNKIRQEIRRLWPIDLFMVDYLQLADADGKYERRDLEVASIARAMKKICREFKIPGIVAAQLSRAAEQRASSDKRPIMSDLGESSEIEKVADKIIFIHRPTDNGTQADLVIAKQRNGPAPAICVLTYVGYKTRFENQARGGF